jgi:hypothetical protein
LLECGDRWSGNRHGRHQQSIETGRLRRDPVDQIATGGPKSDVLDSCHRAGTLDTRPNAGVVLTTASLQQRLVPSISFDRREPAIKIYRRHLAEVTER